MQKAEPSSGSGLPGALDIEVHTRWRNAFYPVVAGRAEVTDWSECASGSPRTPAP